MNVFVLCTGRCGSVTFVKACKHMTNYTASHESRAGILGEARFQYSQNHIEADNGLSWFLGRLERAYGDDAVYVHLKRDQEATARSWTRRWFFGILLGYRKYILAGRNPCRRGLNESDRMRVCMDYCETVNSNIELFLANKTKKMTFLLENATQDFAAFWDMIGAEGDRAAATAEWNVAHNSSDPLRKNLKRRRTVKTLFTVGVGKTGRIVRLLPSFIKHA